MASTKENVVITAGTCSVTLIPKFGGKIAQITANGHNLLQPPLAPYAPRTRETPFEESDASGWDECLPSVAACTVATPDGPAHVPDHGDLWRVPWDLIEHTPTSATLRGQCFSLPLELTRSTMIEPIENGWRLRINYTLLNRGAHEVPWSWAAHSLFTVEPGDTLHLPKSIKTLRLEGSGNNRLGQANDIISWPIAQLPDGTSDDLSTAKPATTEIGDKLFAGPITDQQDGWCAIVRPSAHLRITLQFDIAQSPYLGLWLCYGGWPSRPGAKQICIAPEPTTAPVDSLAVEGPWTRTIQAGESISWPVLVTLHTL